MEFIAHIRDKDKSIQTVKEHLLGVQNLTEEYGEPLNIKHITGLAGLLHDLGKYTNEFKQYIQDVVYNPDTAPKRGGVSIIQRLEESYYLIYFMTPKTRINAYWPRSQGNSIISHHSYLHDFLNDSIESPYLRRVQKKQLEEFQFSVTNF